MVNVRRREDMALKVKAVAVHAALTREGLLRKHWTVELLRVFIKNNPQILQIFALTPNQL